MILRSNGRQEDKAMRERPVRLLLGLKKDHYAIQDLLAEIVVDDGAVPALPSPFPSPFPFRPAPVRCVRTTFAD
jgi:hypothetical protein